MGVVYHSVTPTQCLLECPTDYFNAANVCT